MPQRAHLELSASRGNHAAIEALRSPGYPESLGYLLLWAYALHGRSGAGPGGLAMLSYSEIHAWSALTGIVPSPDEVEALIALDAALLDPSAPQPEQTVPKAPPAWPVRRAE